MKLSNQICNELFNQLPLDTKRLIIAMITELLYDEEKRPNWPKDSVKGSAIVIKKTDGLTTAAVRHKYQKKGYYNMVSEAIRTAAVCIRFAKNHPELESTKQFEQDTIYTKNPTF